MRPHFLLLTFALFTCFSSQGATLQTIAGTGHKGFSGDTAAARDAELNMPTGLTADSRGALFFCDTLNHRIRKIAADGKISTIAGTGEPGWSGDGGPALAAKLHEPYEVRFDAAGNLFWVERLSHCVRKLDTKTGTVTTIAGTGTPGFAGDGGPATKAQLNEPHSIGFDKRGDLYICDVKNHRVRKVDMKTGVISTFGGTGERKPSPDGAPISGTPLSGPRALDFDRDGNLWLALREGNAILKLDLAKGVIHHVAGTGQKGSGGNGGPALEATLNGPKGIAVGPKGNVYIADTENHVIRIIDAATGKIDLLAGTGEKGDGPDGDPLKCRLNRPHGIYVAADGTVFIGDSEAERIRKITKDR
jgi:sugar lactone lactonase YvrE